MKAMTTHAQPTPRSAAARFDKPRAIVGAGLLLLALVVFADASQLPPAPAAGIGPAVGMLFVAGLLGVLGALHLVTAARRAGVTEATETTETTETPAREPMNWKAVGWVLAGLLALMAVLQLQSGFIAGATLLFIATALGFGERRVIRSAAIGVVLNLVVYAFFAKALSLALPAGPLERLVFG
ncbi:tripartite tricarboxylate transporter TctB family protein [Cupriavidus sp. P-10]|uniref:tripartite tricarboxylate transporter TctB family protein n=1 Tax=Cupriavidus sp. P-10 TaxID=2027911 RepID=UPI000E2FCA5F|nr:tripartite tricarboxylate transporter TctB family protein [Cupriavidus sp. P-10]BDB24141.1 tripartite tricarboxylate transporter TctB family protein [Cupriavidus sp. P-10]